MMTLTEAKERLTIPQIWKLLNLPRDCSRNPCHSPFYEQGSKPSFSVSADGKLFNDFRTGEKGDAVDFLRIASGLSEKEACRKFLEMAGGASLPLPAIKASTTPAQPRQKPVLPAMRGGTREKLEAVARLRNLSFEAVYLAASVGLLRFGQWHDAEAWFVTDDDGYNCQARRMDGQPWAHIEAKAQTLPGCWATWPIGAGIAASYPRIMLCEGVDILAALHFIQADPLGQPHICPVAMLGASQGIHPDALPAFADKRVRIYAHADKAGRDGAERWAAQLATVGAQVDIVDFTGLRKADGSPVKDLNDCADIHPDDLHELSDLLPE